MSKITFRADDDLVEQLEELDRSKSEAMREALRSYLESDGTARSGGDRNCDTEGAIDELVRKRVDERLEARLRELGLERVDARTPSTDPQAVTVTVSLEGEPRSDERADRGRTRETVVTQPTDDGERARTHEPSDTPPGDGDVQCNQCGDQLEGNHVYCPNCGEKASRRLFCDCGDEVRSDWSFCPGCGRRTPAADVLESDNHQY
ncbi:ribbon-helix-helix protein, CopG family [Natrinema pallidum]|uniref:Ribbon-helix-helix protein, CopG family n=1 Tax=Natrinema pallidum TaxID=69527 RepID=A0A4V1IEW6_9EURY|nr:ribbon-helix-helix protein, CopG family [Natrinema pallidum]QCW02924.1 ribbon-helix-helix protein, CopG family [Natrinema pallidum]